MRAIATGKPLVLAVSIFALASCDVARDLSTERFACGSGGECASASDAGVDAGVGDTGVSTIVRACGVAEDCHCYSGESCNLTCTLQCDSFCADNTTCTVQCAAGGCNLDCGAGATCHMNCPLGGCSIACGSGAICTRTCGIGGCSCVGAGCR